MHSSFLDEKTTSVSYTAIVQKGNMLILYSCFSNRASLIRYFSLTHTHMHVQSRWLPHRDDTLCGI